MQKLDFLQHDFPKYLEALDIHTIPVFGKMNVQQMIEHMAYAFQQANGKLVIPNTQPDSVTEKMYLFMMSDRPFKDNTPNPNLPVEPEPAKFASKQEAIDALRSEIQTFISVFKEDETLRIVNPFFGNLNFQEWVHLLHKHALHHLRQFNIIPTS
ncbi:MAG: DinB family protein [Chitinophagaceae bacterium]|nr:DinB family protein [Chitinophagaceae bacterium]